MKDHVFGTVSAEKRVYKPWLNEDDFKNVFFCSTHLYKCEATDVFYPGTGSHLKNTRADQENGFYPGGILNVPIPAHASAYVWRNMYTTKIFPRLMEFKPDFILVSAGFDAHQQDEIHSHMSSITEADYKWVTKKLQMIANTVCEGRLVSVMEGGYNTTGGGQFSPLAKSIEAHVEALVGDRGAKF